MRGRPRQHSFRELINAIFYLTKSGCQWRFLPEHFALWGTVYHYFRKWKQSGLWQAIHDHLCEHVRLVEDRRRDASAAIIDTQSVKSSEMSGERGYDAGKKINGRKRHVLVDTIGLILMVMVLPAHIQDRDAARQLIGAFMALDDMNSFFKQALTEQERKFSAGFGTKRLGSLAASRAGTYTPACLARILHQRRRAPGKSSAASERHIQTRIANFISATPSSC